MGYVPNKQLTRLAAIVFASLLIAARPGMYLLHFAYYTGDQSYILLVPVLVALLVHRDGNRIFASISQGFSAAAGVFMAAGASLIGAAYVLSPGSEWQMAATAIGLVAVWVGGFILCFGAKSARAAAFPLAMLVWIMPIPPVIVESFRYFLQVGSTEAVAILFQLTGVPVLRQGFFFHLPTQSIEVAKECSGIRSSLCLIVLTLVIAHESIRSNYRRAVLLVAIVPIVILKNGVRIVTLTLLAVYVDPSFLTGHLHHDGGIVFFLLGLLMLVPVMALLRRGEPEMHKAQHVVAGQ